MASELCDRAIQDYETAIYAKQNQVDKQIADALSDVQLARAALIVSVGAGSGVGLALLLGGEYGAALLVLGASGIVVWFAYRRYQQAQAALAAARALCAQLLAQAQAALAHICARCTKEAGYDRNQECLDRAKELSAMSCG